MSEGRYLNGLCYIASSTALQNLFRITTKITKGSFQAYEIEGPLEREGRADMQFLWF